MPQCSTILLHCWAEGPGNPRQDRSVFSGGAHLASGGADRLPGGPAPAVRNCVQQVLSGVVCAQHPDICSRHPASGLRMDRLLFGPFGEPIMDADVALPCFLTG